MLQFEKALRLAESWLSIVVGDHATIDTRNIKTLPYGWIFPWNGKQYLADPARAFELSLIGNNPIFVDRVNAELLVAGPAGFDWLQTYESKLPPARLQLAPEYPSLESHGNVSIPHPISGAEIDQVTGLPHEG